MRPSIYALALLILTACGKDDPKGAGPGTDTDVVLPGELDESWVDTLPEGLKDPPENAHGGLDLAFDPTLRDAVTAYADCGAWMSGCLKDTSGDFAGCIDVVPICQTEEPWNEGDCCPAACQADFRAAVGQGTDPADAYMDIFALDRTCFPGLQGGGAK